MYICTYLPPFNLTIVNTITAPQPDVQEALRGAVQVV